MIARLVNASWVSCLARRARLACTAGTPALMVVLLVLVALTSGCKKKKKPKPFPPAPQLVSTATTAGAALGPADAGLIPVQMAPVSPSSLPAAADTMSPPDRAAFEEAKATIADLEAMAKRGVVTNPDKPDDGDATMKCSTLESSRPRLEALAEPEAKKLLTDEKRLCSFEIPMISADKTLKQVTISPSQASRQLMCKYASKDLDKARSYGRTDRRVRDLDARFAKACR